MDKHASTHMLIPTINASGVVLFLILVHLISLAILDLLSKQISLQTKFFHVHAPQLLATILMEQHVKNVLIVHQVE